MAIFWLAVLAFSIISLLHPASGKHTAFTVLFQFGGYFFLAAGTAYHSLAVRGLTGREVFDLELNENYCFSALLLSLVFWLDFGYGFFAGLAGTVKLFMMIVAIILYAAIAAMMARWKLYKCEHPILED